MTMARNVSLYRWFKFFQSLLFWQATWFLFFQETIGPAQAILIYAIFEVSTTVMEVPAGVLSDRAGRRITLVLAALAGGISAGMQAFGDAFWVFAAAQVFLGLSTALNSGTDSAFLYESLHDQGRADQMERQSLIAWRFGFSGFAISAVLGGGLGYLAPRAPFVATAIAFAAAFIIAMMFVEPPKQARQRGGWWLEIKGLRAVFEQPVLAWLMVLGMSMYVFSHVPFVFGQPFILQALTEIGLSGEAPIVSGAVTAIMMMVSVLASFLALGMRRRFGLVGILLGAIALQVVIIAGLAWVGTAAIIAILFLRMVPNALSQPFVDARIQPLLQDQHRATFLSVQSFLGRLIFAGSLYFAAIIVGPVEVLSHGEISAVLWVYATVGAVVVLGLALAARRVRVDPS